MPKFHTTNGKLTAYALACGYIETQNDGATRTVLWQEHGTYHVRAHDHETGKRIFWESFRTLREARRHFAHARALIVAHRSAS